MRGCSVGVSEISEVACPGTVDRRFAENCGESIGGGGFANARERPKLRNGPAVDCHGEALTLLGAPEQRADLVS